MTQRIEDPDEESLGPAMKKLTALQRRFVLAYVYIGTSGARCAEAAGYSNTHPQATNTAAIRLLAQENIQDAIHEVGMQLFGSLKVPAIKFVADVIEGRTLADVKERLKATEMLFNRIGMPAMTEHKVAVTHKSESNEEMVLRIEHLAKKYDIDPKKLLGNIIDAEYVEIPKSELQQAADDLGDIL